MTDADLLRIAHADLDRLDAHNRYLQREANRVRWQRNDALDELVAVRMELAQVRRNLRDALKVSIELQMELTRLRELWSAEAVGGVN